MRWGIICEGSRTVSSEGTVSRNKIYTEDFHINCEMKINNVLYKYPVSFHGNY
jgi:hypothetical protein